MTEVLPELPEGWVWASLGDVASVVGGSTPSSKRPDYWGGDIRWLAVSDFTGYTQKHIGRGARTITQEGYSSCSTQLVPPGTVLFSSRAPIGYVAIASSELCTSQGFKSFVPEEGISSDFLYWYLHYIKPLAEERATGTTFKELSGKAAAALPIPLAPREEQERIAARLDSLSRDLDAGLASLAEVDDLLVALDNAILTSAVTGTLSERGAGDADAELEAVLKWRRERWEELQIELFERRGKVPSDGSWKNRYTEPLLPTPDATFDLPDGWTWATVDQVSSLVQYGTSSKTWPDLDGVPVLRMGNIDQGELARLEELKYLGSDHPEFPDLLLEDGDLLFNRTNSAELVGKTAVYRNADAPAPCSFASYLIRVRLVEGVAPEYVALFINSRFGREWVASVASQQVGQANVNGTKLRALTFPLPPYDEQLQIVEAARNWRKAAHSLATELASVRSDAQSLQRSILVAGFSGALKTRSPADQTAEELLAAIAETRAERARLRSHGKNRHERANAGYA